MVFPAAAGDGGFGIYERKKAADWSSKAGLALLPSGTTNQQLHAENIRTEADLVNLLNQNPGMYQKGINSDTPEVGLFTGQVPLFTEARWESQRL